MPLTDTAVRNAKGAERQFKIADGGGLYVLVQPNGTRLWRMDYRFNGKRLTLAIGRYPEVGLADARKAREAAREQLAKGEDPSFKKKMAKVAAKVASANTFRAVAEEYVDKLKREKQAEATLQKTEWLLGLAYPNLGSRPIAEITAPEVLAVLQAVERRGRHESARRLRSTISRVFRYAVATARAEIDPTFALRGALTAPVVTSRAAITNPAALGGLLRAIDGFEGQPTTKAALQLMAMLFPRPGELRQAEWCEFDLAGAVWSIPEGRMKMRRPHRVPLPRQAIELLRNLQAITGQGTLAFPSVRTVRRPISENTMNAALRRLGYTQAEASSHGFRATASTLLNESGLWNPDAIERQLAHVDGNSVRRAYARGEHWDERMRMMQWWADFLDERRSACGGRAT